MNSDKDDTTAPENALQEQIAKLTDIAARAQADLLNYKERMQREADDLRKFAIAPLVLKLLPLRDDLLRATNHSDDDGYIQLLTKFDEILSGFGVKKIKALGEKIDPTKHEVLNMGPGEKDLILSIHQEGFMLNDKVLRPATVMVGDGSNDDV